jgi:hypothetical protein
MTVKSDKKDEKPKNEWLTISPDAINQDLNIKLKAKSYHIGKMPDVLMASPD